MMATAAIAARLPTCPGDVVVSGEKTRFGRQRLNSAPALRVEVRHLGRVLPGLNVSRASPLWFRLAVLPEDGVAAEAVEAIAEPAVEAPTYEGPTVKVKFELQRECHFGQQFKVVGGDSKFGDWEPSAAAPLNWSEGHVWTAEVDVPEGKRFEYKYVLIGQEGEVEWQPGSNLVLETAAGAEPLVISDTWEETQPEPTAELEVLPADLEVQPAEPEVPPTEPEVSSIKIEVPPTKSEVEPTKLEVPPAEPEVQSAESDTGDWETHSADAEVNTPADALADVAASAAVGALNAGVKAAHAIEGGLDAISPVSDSPSSETNGVAESKEEETPTATEIPVVDAALAATAEPAAPAEEPLNTNNGASSTQAESSTTEEKLRIEESSMEATSTRIEEQPSIEEPKKRLNPFQKDIEWLSKTFFGR